MKDNALKLTAIEMRKNGNTFLEISKKINVNESTVGKWVCGIKLSKEQISNKLKNIKLLESEKRYKKTIIDKITIENALFDGGFYGALTKLNLTDGCLKYWCKQYNIDLSQLRKERKTYTHCEICKVKYDQFQKKKYKTCCSCVNRIRRLTNKIRAIEYMGGKCNQCGCKASIENYAAFDFHHNNKDKEITIGQHLNQRWNLIKLELDKCQMLCSNCHRIEHSNYVYSNIIYEIASKKLMSTKKIREDIDAKLNIINESELSNMVKALSLKTISEKMNIPQDALYHFCKLKNIIVPQKHFEKLKVNKEELETIISQKPMSEIGKIFNVSDNAIRKRCLRLGIDYKKISPTAHHKKTKPIINFIDKPSI